MNIRKTTDRNAVRVSFFATHTPPRRCNCIAWEVSSPSSLKLFTVGYITMTIYCWCPQRKTKNTISKQIAAWLMRLSPFIIFALCFELCYFGLVVLASSPSPSVARNIIYITKHGYFSNYGGITELNDMDLHFWIYGNTTMLWISSNTRRWVKNNY